MAAHASFTADLHTKGYETGVARIENVTKAASSKMARDFQQVEKSANSMRLGQVAMQAQDVAVSLQNGASAATVLAQQGSQIASIFGPTGMIVGGVLAVGAGIIGWATSAKDANNEIKETMRLLGEAQASRSRSLGNAQSDSMAAAMGRITGPRADIGRLRMEFEADIKRLEDEFRKTPIHRRDFGVHDREVAARTDRFNSDRERLYDAHEDEAAKKRAAEEEKKQQAEVRELRSVEKEQMLNYIQFRKEQDDHEEEARSLLEESIRKAAQVEKDNATRNERLGELREQLTKETAKQSIQNQAASGNSIIQGAQEFLKPQSQRIAEREAGQAEERAINREVSRRLDRADQHRRSIGADGISPEEREELRANEMENVKTARNKEKLLASLDDDSVKRIQDAIEKLITK